MLAHATRKALVGILVLAFATAAPSMAVPTPQEPLAQDVVYKIHSDPNDPNSVVSFTIWLSLEQADTDGDSIGWKILQIRFRQTPEAYSEERIWTDSDPNVPSSDGLWWVEHADPNDPQLAEFDTPPHLVGTAAAQDPNDPDLEYDVNSGTYSPPPGGNPWGPTTALTYELTVGDPPPEKEGDDEPGEIDDEDDPPV